MPFTIDAEYDRASASDGVSRYGRYIRSNARNFDSAFDENYDRAYRAASFAEQAWRVATPPSMSPGYVRFHRRVQTANLEWNNADFSLVALVPLVTAWPKELIGPSDWKRGRRWRDWPQDGHGPEARFVNPSDEQLTAAPYLLPAAQAVFTVPMFELPASPPDDHTQLLNIARDTVAHLVLHLNAVLEPLITRLEAGR